MKTAIDNKFQQHIGSVVVGDSLDTSVSPRMVSAAFANDIMPSFKSRSQYNVS